jgi:tRNA1(Val) A37 N6-methylase TrmN6
MELRGSVFDYCRTAARLMKPDGTFVFVHAAHDPRPEQAITEAGLTLNERRDVVFRDGRPPTIAVFRCSFGGDRRDATAFIMRTAEGDWGPDRELLREAVGLKG